MTMQAWQIVEYGAPPRLAEVAEPEVAGDSELVEVTAVSITPLDLLVATGASYFGQPDLPYVPGVQGVGRLASGQRVWFTTTAGIGPGQGSLAQRIAVERGRMWEIPVDVPDAVVPDAVVADAVVAGLGLSAVAAAGVLRQGRFAAGDRVLVLGGAGVVGRVAAQLARAWGAGFVAVACRGAERAADLGADVVIDIAGMDQAAMASAFAEAVGEGVDLVVDPVWGAPAEAAISVLRPGGRLVNLGDSAGPSAAFASAVVRSKQLQILGYTNLGLTWQQQTDALGEILALVAAGEVSMEPEVVAFEDAAEGWQRQSDGRAASRVVVAVG